MISVALCTYNGSRFLGEQLASIRAQSRPVDELVVCDDRSTDDTVSLLRTFAETVSFPVRVHVNETNRGSTKNFEKALSLCQGDLLFCCDQDDVWRTDKVQVLTEYLAQHPEHEAVFSNARVIDEASQPTGRTIWEEIEFGPDKQAEWRAGRGYETLFGSYVVTGATLALRRRILPRVTPFPTVLPELIHDGWLALVLSLTNQIGFVDDTLLDYRRHAQQQVGFGKKGRWVTLQDRFSRDRTEKLAPLRTKAEHATVLYNLLRQVPGVPPEKLETLRQRQAHFTRRASLPAARWRRLGPVWDEWQRGRYRLSSPQWWRPVLGDLLE
jgi:cellulose synthase/poly-beta-1,6-N-acetylglucosamine synthase-like glycosyltransferase